MVVSVVRLLLIVCLGLPLGTFAETLEVYVTPEGTCTNCTLLCPCPNIQNALDLCQAPYDSITVNLGAGIFEINSELVLPYCDVTLM